MLKLLVAIAGLLVSSPALAQIQSVKLAPTISHISISVGNSTYQDLEVPFSVPYTGQACAGATGSISGDIVDSAIEVTLIVDSGGGSSCGEWIQIVFDLSFETVALGPDVASLFVQPVGTKYQSSSLGRVESVFGHSSPQFQSRDFGRVRGDLLPSASIVWRRDGLQSVVETERNNAGGLAVSSIAPVPIQTWHPDDAVSIGARIEIRTVAGGATGSLAGSFTSRYEIRQLFPRPVPEPAAGITVPIGALGIASLVALRGS